MFKTLIVEDNDNFRHLLHEVLQIRFPCMIIEESGNGMDALDKLLHPPPQLIFMDIKLPGINGLELTRSIKGQHAGIVIAMITAYDIPEYRDAAFKSGADYFLPKSDATGHAIQALVDNAFPQACG